MKILYRKYEYHHNFSKRDYSPSSWFELDKNIHVTLVPCIENRFIPESDIIFATEWTTAYPVSKLKASKGDKYYFIQSLETWLGPEKEVIKTWKLPLKKIVISKWLQEFGKSLNEECYYIPNGFDMDQFAIDIPPNKKKPYDLLMLYHKDPVKGSKYGLEALIKIKFEFKDVNIRMFSSFPKSTEIPEWVEYYHRPDQTILKELYNTSAIFISPSIFEGFPLPPAEAMLCGCSVIATNIGGHREYCYDNKTAVLVEPR
ncbi:MAG: glycosyltransferase family 4 protein, partial [Ignavibacteria bacterium]|nr:glycosyltransferase family 4 protein [Ignavibacteria bacterium]